MVEIPPMTNEQWDAMMKSMTATASRQVAPEAPAPAKKVPDEIDWPPGIAGSVALEIYTYSARPVKTVSIATTIGLLAGICGLKWNTNTAAGLNLYLTVVARTGVGKEAISDAIPALIREAVKKQEHSATSFFTFRSMASGQGLFTALADAPFSCLLHVDGEFGHNIQFMATDKSGPYATLRQQMTRLYTKSAPSSMAGGIQRSKADDSVEIEGSASYSIIGDTTPGTFFEALNGKMMSDGFMARFIVIEYDGPRPPLNENRKPFSNEAVTWFTTLVQQAVKRTTGDPTPVAVAPDALARLRLFGSECDDKVNETNDEGQRQMWSRAHLSALKVASLLAVADSYGMNLPTVTDAQAEWAIKLLLRNIANMRKRLDSGDVGGGDDARERKLVSIMKEYALTPVAASYKVPAGMRENMIVPRSYLQVRTTPVAAFYDHKLGTVKALDDAIQSMVASGYLMECEKLALAETYNYRGRAYRILHLPDYDHSKPPT